MEQGPSLFQRMLILTVIHVRTPVEHHLHSELGYWSHPKTWPIWRR
jgi:hypothetical protein